MCAARRVRAMKLTAEEVEMLRTVTEGTPDVVDAFINKCLRCALCNVPLLQTGGRHYGPWLCPECRAPAWSFPPEEKHEICRRIAYSTLTLLHTHWSWPSDETQARARSIYEALDKLGPPQLYDVPHDDPCYLVECSHCGAPEGCRCQPPHRPPCGCVECDSHVAAARFGVSLVCQNTARHQLVIAKKTSPI